MNLRQPRSSKPPLPRSGEYEAVRHVPYTGPCDDVASATDSDWPFEVPPGASRARARMCDAVRVKGEAGDGVVYLSEGALVWVQMDANTRARMGVTPFRDRLIASEHVSLSELELVAALSRSDGSDVCDRLVELGLVEATVLHGAFCETMREHLRALLSMPDREASSERVSVLVPARLSVALPDVLEPIDVRRWQRLVASDELVGHHEARIPLRRTAQVDTVNGTVMMTTLDISEAGMRLRASSLVPLASRVVVRLSVAGDQLELAGRVVRFDRTEASELPAIVVMWTELPAATEQTFARILEALY